MDRLDAMAVLVKVIDTGSLSAAGRALQVPLATLSRRISDLEALLGARLLIRTTRKLTLTDAGQAYVAAARRILALVDEAEQEAAGEFRDPKGELVVTAPVMFGRLHVLPIVADFLAAFPQVDIRLVLADRNVDLVEDQVDMAVRIGHLPDSAMVATRVGALRLMTCASPRWLKDHGVPRQPADLAGRPCIAVDGPAPATSWRFHDPRTGAALDVALRPRLRVSTPEAAREAALRHVGVVRLLHYQAVDALRAGTLRVLLPRHEPAPVPVHLVHAARGQMPLKMRRFLDVAAPRLRQALEALAAAGAA